MILDTFPRVAALALYLLSSGFLSANDEAFLMNFEEETQQKKMAPKASTSSQDDPLLSELEKKVRDGKEMLAQQAREIEAMKKRLAAKNKAEKEAQDVEAQLAQQAQEMADLMALLNPTPKPKQTPAPVASSSAAATASIPPSPSDAIPEIARGYEDIYRRFLGGKLIYTDPSSKAKKELPIRALANPLEGTFDLSGCGDTGQYLSISTGYRKILKAENAHKLEIWLTPRFLVERELASTAKHLQPIMRTWDSTRAPVGIFWTFGDWDLQYFDHRVTESMNDFGSWNMHDHWKHVGGHLADRGIFSNTGLWHAHHRVSVHF